MSAFVRPSSAPLRPSTASSANAQSLLSSTHSQHNAAQNRTSAPMPPIPKEVFVIDERYSAKIFVDNREEMMSLMNQAKPSPPPRAGSRRRSKTEGQNTEAAVYLRTLSRSLDEATRRRKPQQVRSVACVREVMTATAATPTSAGADQESFPQAAEKPALRVWVEEERSCGTIGLQSPNVSPSKETLLNKVERGRFPLDTSPPISGSLEVSGAKEKQMSQSGEAFLTTFSPFSARPSMQDRIRVEPIRSWRVFHNLTSTPLPPSRRKSSFQDSMDLSIDHTIVDRWRHRFDYVNYTDQFGVDEFLDKRALCRNMVVKQFLNGNDKDDSDDHDCSHQPLVKMASVFEDTQTHMMPSKFPPQLRTKNPLWRSIWTRKANEIALEKERDRLIKSVKDFKLCVAASTLSKEVVDELQADLVRAIQKWPCSYKKLHIFTRANFVSWIRERYNFSVLLVSDDAASPSLMECMASAAEAAFVGYILNVLPDAHSTSEHDLLE